MLWAPMYFMGIKVCGLPIERGANIYQNYISYLPTKESIPIQLKLSGDNNWPKGNFSRSYNRIIFLKLILKKCNSIFFLLQDNRASSRPCLAPPQSQQH
jgi:hypothetical protein